ncbi:3-beta hydroxysteroid dehydrogenase/isomerase [Colletotrichum higginsianum]|uniref:Sterol-4-alpha-carboxylate 3-dehydrogenase ERG26, decarboxylating n=2 Tax=Colletotrichum higginsianum TaxID=80884 RepID=H1VMR2_COLHI|nr:3-beta hydroxysteroid dehydrogenase/isomerase [Colletotrichum higginsianum IMI 349063]OBR15460.1 3-beta hydroxysteroid dehydrogenase/isomerase [Colletotrichum higginsianum IMI 349063]TID04428.1 Sterol-4-alpha-carboxylate 3-dehydrogenase, decarboxylating [Colletotrichum higginsianum]CCF41516.1 3-beta hydroxysteroid dehydrogenase/isomerase [Colletotrichum higginsianum]
MSEKKPATLPNLGKVLVIGGNGFLGHHVVNQLLAGDRWAVAAVDVIDLRCGHNRHARASYHEADITDTDKVKSIIENVKPDVVIHTASPAVQGDNAVAKDLFRKVNVDGTASVVAACQAASVKALVYTSSASIISDNTSDLINADERWPVIRGELQTEYYSETKAAAEELVLDANRQDPYPLLTCSIRPAGIFGEGDTMVTHQMVKIYREGKTGIQLGSNENLFDFTYVGNVAHAHLLAARLLLATAASSTAPLDHEKVDGEAFLVTNDSPIYFWDFARAIWRAAGSDKGTSHVWAIPREIGLVLGFCSEVFFTIIGKPPIFNRQRNIYSCMTRYYNIGKAKRLLGYRPIVGLDEGIKRGVQWFLDQENAGKVSVKA